MDNKLLTFYAHPRFMELMTFAIDSYKDEVCAMIYSEFSATGQSDSTELAYYPAGISFGKFSKDDDMTFSASYDFGMYGTIFMDNALINMIQGKAIVTVETTALAKSFDTSVHINLPLSACNEYYNLCTKVVGKRCPTS